MTVLPLRRDRSSLALAAVVASVLALPGAARADTAAEIGDQIVVRHAAGAGNGERAEVRADADVTLDQRLLLPGVEVVDVGTGSRADALAALRSDPGVVWAEPNRVVRATTDDQYWPMLWGLENDGTPFDDGTRGTVDADIDATQAWTVSRGSGVTVGVVDTGVSAGHPDLAGQTVAGRNFVADGRTSPADGNGHGTHVSGTIAALQNTIGVVGVAPAAKVMPLRALDDNGVGSSAGVANAFAYAGAQGLRIVNASLGSPSPTLAERQAIAASPNTLFVVAAGNDGQDVDGGGAYPCAYTYANVLCVGASDVGDGLADFSNRGATAVDLVAPGARIASTWLAGGYAVASGTSMASPVVAGAAALLVSAHPDWSVAAVKAALMNTVDRPAGVAGVTVTGGRLNAARALGLEPDGTANATPQPTPTPTPTPTTPGASTTPPPPSEPEAPAAGQPASGTPSEGQPSSGAPAAGKPSSGAPVEGEPTSGAPTSGEPSTDARPVTPSVPVPSTPVLQDPGSTTVTAPTTAPGGIATPGTPSLLPLARLERVRTIRSGGRPRAVTFELSGAANVRVQVQRRDAARRFRAVRSADRTLALPAGPARLAVGAGAQGLGLTRGTWKVTVSAPSGRGTVVLTLR